MSEVVDIFNAMRSESQDRRKRNREASARLLQERGITFTVHNEGAHLRVQSGHDSAPIDFWPGTGKWIDHETGVEGRGVFKLLRYMGKDVSA